MCKSRWARRSASSLNRFWLMSTKVERKIASSETIMVSSPYGNGSKGRKPRNPSFTRIHAPNQATCR